MLLSYPVRMSHNETFHIISLVVNWNFIISGNLFFFTLFSASDVTGQYMAVCVWTDVIGSSVDHWTSTIVQCVNTKSNSPKNQWLGNAADNEIKYWMCDRQEIIVAFVICNTRTCVEAFRVVIQFISTKLIGQNMNIEIFFSSYQLNAHFLYSITIYMLHYMIIM